MTVKLAEVVKAEGLTLSDDASKAVVRLAQGDMRKVLNTIESCSLAYKDIEVNKIYEVTGRPSIDDIELIYKCLTMEGYVDAFTNFLRLK